MLETEVVQRFKSAVPFCHDEDGFDEGVVFANADVCDVGAFAEDELDGVDDDGFAGAGLAGEHVETAVERQIDML